MPSPLFVLAVFVVGYFVLTQIRAPGRPVAGGTVISTPVVVDDRIVYADSAGKVFAADSKTGQTVWQYAAGASTFTATAGEITGTVGEGMYFQPCADGSIVALDMQTGIQRWQQRLGAIGTTVIGTLLYYDGILYAPCNVTAASGAAPQGDILALDVQNGAKRWSLSGKGNAAAGHTIKNRLAVDLTNNAIVFVSGSGKSGKGDLLMEVDAKSGDRLWLHPAGGK